MLSNLKVKLFSLKKIEETKTLRRQSNKLVKEEDWVRELKFKNQISNSTIRKKNSNTKLLDSHTSVKMHYYHFCWLLFYGRNSRSFIRNISLARSLSLWFPHLLSLYFLIYLALILSLSLRWSLLLSRSWLYFFVQKSLFTIYN